MLLAQTGSFVFPPGFRFRCDRNVNYSGWRCNGGSLWQATRDAEYRCCVSFFSPYSRRQEENKLMLVLTKEVSKDSKGGVDIEEIVSTIIIEKTRNELFEGDCTMNGILFIYSVVNERTRTIIGISVNENGFEQHSFKWAAYPCNSEHDY